MSPRPLLLVFVARGCAPCRALATHFKTLERFWRKRADVMLVFKQPPGEAFDELHELGLSRMSATSSPLLFQVWGITAVPFAVLLDRDGYVHSKGIVNNLDHLEYLVDIESPSRTVNYRLVPPRTATGAARTSATEVSAPIPAAGARKEPREKRFASEPG